MTRNLPAPNTSRTGATLRALGSLAGLTGLLAGVPLLLLATIGNPIPGLQDLIAGDVSDSAVIAVLAGVTWLYWAQFALAVVVETVSILVHAPIHRRIPGVLPSQQHVARALVTAVLVLIPAFGTLTGAAQAAQASTVTGSQPTATATLQPSEGHRPSAARTTQPKRNAASQAGSQQDQAKRPARTHTVTADGPATYWDLAETYLGDGQRWSEIWHLNEGRHQSDGSVMTSPGLLRTGWKVLIPAGPSSEAENPSPAADTVTVHSGDTLDSIAKDNGTTWPTLWQDNNGRTQPNGDHFTDPDHIEPGWTIDVPDEGDEPTRTRPSADPATTDRKPDATAEPDRTPKPPPTARPEDADPSIVPSLYQRPRAGAATPSGPEAGQHRETAPPTPTQLPTERSTAAPTTAAASATKSLTPAAPEDQVPPQLPSLASVVLHGLGPGAGLLAAGALMALLRYRRRQFRYRRPGRMIAATPPDLVVMEKELLAQGSESRGDVAWLDQALRAMAQQLTQAGRQLPDVTAVRVGADVLELVLTRPADPGQAGLPAPWRSDPRTGRWQLRRADHTPDDEQQAALRRWQFAPYPTLVSVGYSLEGDYWLLDVERIGALTLTGDHGRCLDLARFLAADLAHSAWSEQLDVVLVGFGSEVPGINPDRVTYAPDPAAALARLRSQVQTNREVLTHAGLADTLEGRQKDIAADQWMPQVLLIDNTGLDEQSVAQLRALVSAVRGQEGRSGVAVVVTGAPVPVSHPGSADRWQLPVDSDGQVYLAALGLTLRAQQLPAHEASQLARLLASTATLTDRAMPPARGEQPWDRLADAAGAPIPELIMAGPASRVDAVEARVASPHPSPAPAARISLAPAKTTVDPTTVQPDALFTPASTGGPSTGVELGSTPHASAMSSATETFSDESDTHSLVSQSMTSLLAATATTAQDVQTLAPPMSDKARRQVEETDADLDRDLAAWNNPDTLRARLSVLGPVLVRCTGPLPERSPRRPWHTEVVVYLAAARPRGVTAEQFGTDLWPGDPDVTSKSKLRHSVYVARKWLGEDPDTHLPYIPGATESGPTGAGLYRVDGILLDADLFRRLRLRGVARGSDGIEDLEAALRLVTGPPFDQRRADGYTWLADIQLDHEYTGMIVDVAHLVATHHLSTGRPDLAAAAAQISLMAGGHDDVALLDLVAAADAQGNQGEARAWIQRILANHEAEVEEDLPPRTAEILHRRNWTNQPTRP